MRLEWGHWDSWVARFRQQGAGRDIVSPLWRSSMILERDAFLRKLDDTIASHSMLDHPFYQMWNDGKLSKETLQEYVKQY